MELKTKSPYWTHLIFLHLLLSLFFIIFLQSCAQTSKKQNIPSTPSVSSHFPELQEKDFSRIMVQEDLRHISSKESSLSNFLADLIQIGMETDFALLSENDFLLKTFGAGIYTESIFPRFFHPTSEIIILKLSGEQLYLLLRILNSDAFELITPSNLQVRLIDKKFITHATDLNEDHVLSLWEVNRLIQLTHYNGKKILPELSYTLALTQALWGREELKWFRQNNSNALIIHSPQKTQDIIKKSFFDEKATLILQNKSYFQTLKPRIIQQRPLGLVTK